MTGVKDTMRKSIAILLLVLLTACVPQPEQEKVTLTINYPLNDLFYEKYGIAFERQFPHIRFEVVSPSEDTEQHPETDILFIPNLEQYHTFIEQGWLRNLNERIANEDQFRDVIPFAIEGLRYSPDGGIYGLAPRFYNRALYYNRDLFTQYNVEPPTDYMSWEQVLHTANQFSTQEQELYGLVSPYFRDIGFLLAADIGETNGLTYIDPNTKQVSMHTEEWLEIWRDVATSIQNNGVYYHPNQSFEELDNQKSLFLTGKAAMEISSYDLAYVLQDHNAKQADTPLNWGVVTLPSDPETLATDQYRIQDIFAIHHESAHPEEAWTFLEFIHSREEAVQQSRNPRFTSDGLSIHADANVPVDGNSLEPFFLLAYQQPNRAFDYTPYPVWDAFVQAGAAEFEFVLQGEKSVEQALEDLLFLGGQAVEEARSIHGSNKDTVSIKN